MKAYIKNRYGGPEVLLLKEIEKPVLKDDHILVKVKANSANPADWHILRGLPLLARFSFGLFKPKDLTLGMDFAGIVEELGKNVTDFKIGDRVFGEAPGAGAFAEYTCVPSNNCGIIPEGAGYPEMACVPIAGLSALQALITHGKLKEGESVLINGASGGVGHFTVQIAKAYGAKVSAVCSSKNIDFVKGLGADSVIAYDQEDIHKHKLKYDLVIDTHGNLFMEDFIRMGQRGVLLGFTTMGNMMRLVLKAVFSKFPLAQFTAKANTKDLDTLATLIQDGKIRAYIEKSYPYTRIPDAIGYIEAMRTKGKVAMVWEDI